MCTVPYPTYDDLMREVHEIAAADPRRVSYSSLGRSEEGRELPLLTLSDSSVPARDKPVFLLTGGTDGDEEVGRAVCLALARELLRPEHARRLRLQTVLIAPVTNPDGCARNAPDRDGNARGIPAPEVYRTDTPVTAEGRALRALVDEWIPEAHVDFHGLAGGSMGDCAFLYPTVNIKFSLPVLIDVNAKIEAAAAAAGWPQQGRPRVWWEPRYNLPGWLARNHSAFCMILEGTENYYPIADSIASGVIRLLRFMDFAESTEYFQEVPNYPCEVVSGGRMGAVLPYGEDYARRRRCRRDISRMIIEGVPHLGRRECDYDWTAVIRFPVADTVSTFPPGIVFKATIDRRASISRVLWQDHVLEDDLWRQETTAAGIVVTATVPERPVRGENRLSICYEVPFKRHVRVSCPEERV